MDQIQVPFEAFNIDPDEGQRVIPTVAAFLDQHPDAPVSIAEVAAMAEVPETTVKLVLYILLALHHLKAAFRARCRTCGSILSKPQTSMYAIWATARAGQYWCEQCDAPVGIDDVEGELLFLKPGVEVMALELGREGCT